MKCLLVVNCEGVMTPVQTVATCTLRERGLRLPGLPRLSRYDFDGEYVERLVSEDPEIERHFTRYFGDLLSLKLRSKLRSPALIEDAKQETFVRVLTTLKKKGGLATPEGLGAFVNSVANNVLFELYRWGAKVTPLAEDHDEPDERDPDAETTLMAAEERLRVREALADLPQKDKDLLRWVFFEGRDKDEVCRELNIDRNYLRVLLHRAKHRFRDRYVSEEANSPAMPGSDLPGPIRFLGNTEHPQGNRKAFKRRQRPAEECQEQDQLGRPSSRLGAAKRLRNLKMRLRHKDHAR